MSSYTQHLIFPMIEKAMEERGFGKKENEKYERDRIKKQVEETSSPTSENVEP